MEENKMELIAKITDKDIGEETISMEEPRMRRGARGIVEKEDGTIAIFYKENKNEYKLPGGGLEGDEKPEEAFQREVLEETGCVVEIIKNLGKTEEEKSLANFKQTSYVFVAKVINDTKVLNLTQKEKDEGAKLLWKTPEDALKLIKNCYDKLQESKYSTIYSTKFIIVRDQKILEFYLEQKSKE